MGPHAAVGEAAADDAEEGDGAREGHDAEGWGATLALPCC